MTADPSGKATCSPAGRPGEAVPDRLPRRAWRARRARRWASAFICNSCCRCFVSDAAISGLNIVASPCSSDRCAERRSARAATESARVTQIGDGDAQVSACRHDERNAGVCRVRVVRTRRPMLGIARADQLAALENAYASAARGNGRLVVVSGEAGAGKSTLVADLRDRLAPARVLVGYCDPLSAPRPAGPLSDVAASLDGPLAEL